MKPRSILILGGGIIGLCTAYYAARKGHRVTVIDRHPASRNGCSFGNAGMIVPSHIVPLAAPGMVRLGLRMMWNPESPFYIKPRLDAELWGWAWKFWRASTARHVAQSAPLLRDLHLASRAAFAALAALPGNDFGLQQHGLLMLCKTQHALDEEARAAAFARDLGVPADVLDAAATARLDPGLRMDVLGSVYYPKDCHLSPGRFMAGLERQVEALGGVFAWNTALTGWRVEGERIRAALTDRGEFSAEEVVLCGGAWSPRMGHELGLRLPMQAGKGYSLTLPQPRRLPRLCAILVEARMAVTPMGTSLRFGGTMEIAGLREEITPRRVQGLIKSVPRYYPEFRTEDFAGIPPWAGLRPCSPDGLPYIGRVRRYANLSVATGHAMMGVSLGPITGQLMAEILSGGTPAMDLRLVSPDRYA